MTRDLKFLTFCISLLLAFFFNSCVSYKNVPYFQDLDSTKLVSQFPYKPPVIQRNDILGININTLDPNINAMFGIVENQENSASSQSGYLVSENGEIRLPTIGSIKVEGLTTLKAAQLITSKIAQFAKEPTVNVRVLNFKISVTGDVTRPGVFEVQNEKINIIEALTLAGDLKVTAKRNNVLIIRQEEGPLQFARVDLRSKSVFESPYFYLKNNDMLYVEPSVDKLQRDENFYRNASLALGVITVITLVVFRLF